MFILRKIFCRLLRAGSTVAVVSREGQLPGSKLDADLMCASREQPDKDQGFPLMLLNRPVFQRRSSDALPLPLHHIGLVLPDTVVQKTI